MNLKWRTSWAPINLRHRANNDGCPEHPQHGLISYAELPQPEVNRWLSLSPCTYSLQYHLPVIFSHLLNRQRVVPSRFPIVNQLKKGRGEGIVQFCNVPAASSAFCKTSKTCQSSSTTVHDHDTSHRTHQGREMDSTHVFDVSHSCGLVPQGRFSNGISKSEGRWVVGWVVVSLSGRLVPLPLVRWAGLA